MKVAIVGASGQLGRCTLDAVLDRGVAAQDVVAAVRTPDKLREYAARGVGVRAADYNDPGTLRSAFEGVERVLLTPSLDPPGRRCVQYENAIGAARDAGVIHLLHYGVVPTVPESRFVVTPFLLFAESALRTSGLAWTILRNSLYADPIAEWVGDIVKMGTIPYPTRDGRCAFVSRADIGRAGAAALTTDGHEGRIYNLTGPAALSTAELCEILARVTGETVVHREATDEDYLRACLADGTPEHFARLLLTLYWAIRDGHCDVVTNDIEALTGRPAQSLEDYLRKV